MAPPLPRILHNPAPLAAAAEAIEASDLPDELRALAVAALDFARQTAEGDPTARRWRHQAACEVLLRAFPGRKCPRAKAVAAALEAYSTGQWRRSDRALAPNPYPPDEVEHWLFEAMASGGVVRWRRLVQLAEGVALNAVEIATGPAVEVDEATGVTR